ncbi:MAG: hypothetical protein AB8H47_13810 [Bacteroidia bacterium]
MKFRILILISSFFCLKLGVAQNTSFLGITDSLVKSNKSILVFSEFVSENYSSTENAFIYYSRGKLNLHLVVYKSNLSTYIDTVLHLNGEQLLKLENHLTLIQIGSQIKKENELIIAGSRANYSFKWGETNYQTSGRHEVFIWDLINN